MKNVPTALQYIILYLPNNDSKIERKNKGKMNTKKNRTNEKYKPFLLIKRSQIKILNILLRKIEASWN
jgi:hypothetical protein